MFDAFMPIECLLVGNIHRRIKSLDPWTCFRGKETSTQAFGIGVFEQLLRELPEVFGGQIPPRVSPVAIRALLSKCCSAGCLPDLKKLS